MCCQKSGHPFSYLKNIFYHWMLFFLLFHDFLIYYCRAQHITFLFRKTPTSRQSDHMTFFQISMFTLEEISSKNFQNLLEILFKPLSQSPWMQFKKKKIDETSNFFPLLRAYVTIHTMFMLIIVELFIMSQSKYWPKLYFCDYLPTQFRKPSIQNWQKENIFGFKYF